jgi:hypothetical protein
MIVRMNESDCFTIECGTCLAAGTTACNECIVTHLLANDDGPIRFDTVNFSMVKLGVLRGSQERAIDLFERAGLLDDPVEFVPVDVFASFASGDLLAPSLG